MPRVSLGRLVRRRGRDLEVVLMRRNFVSGILKAEEVGYWGLEERE
jgi:hypothetical protein